MGKQRIAVCRRPCHVGRANRPGRAALVVDDDVAVDRVGELAVAFSFMDELRRRAPNLRFVLTTNTSTGHALALQKVHAPDVTLYLPMDVPLVMRRALRRIRPAIVVLIENEMWPNLIRYSRKRGIR